MSVYVARPIVIERVLYHTMPRKKWTLPEVKVNLEVKLMTVIDWHVWDKGVAVEFRFGQLISTLRLERTPSQRQGGTQSRQPVNVYSQLNRAKSSKNGSCLFCSETLLFFNKEQAVYGN